MRFALAVLLLMLAAASPARADWLPPREAVARLARGEVHADVAPDGGEASGVVHGAVDVDAPAEIVWATILDCVRADRMAPGVKGCRVVARDPAGRWDEREMLVQWAPLTPTFRTVLRSDFDPPTRIRFRCVDGDIKACHGQWRLIALPDGRTRVLYENRARSPISMPAALTRAAMRGDVARALKALRREAEGRAR